MADLEIVGRDRELQHCFDAAGRPGCVGVVLIGPAGVGKTALANAVAARKRADGAELVRIAATRSASAIPLGAVAPLLVLPSAPTTQADLIRHTVAALTTRATAARADGRELVVLVDDAHHLDNASATMVQQLALAGSTSLIITLRAEELVSDSITALWKDGLAERLDISVLGLAQSTAVATAILGGPIAPAAATTLFEASGGNPLFLHQLVASARADGALVLAAGRGPVAGRWTLIAPLPLPGDLVSAVEARLEHLTEDDRAVIELLALGEPLDASVLEQLAGDDAAERLERLEAGGFIAAEIERHRITVRLAHPMYGEVLRATMPTTWANRARLLLASTMAEHPQRRQDDAIRIATWRLDAAATIPAAIANEAAQKALLRFDYALAERIVRSSDGYRPAGPVAESRNGLQRGSAGGSVIESGGPDSADPSAELLLANIAARAGRAVDALNHLDQLDRMLDLIEHDGQLRSRGVVLRFDVLGYTLSRYEEAFALEIPADGDPSVGSALTARKVVVAVNLAQPRLAESLLATMPRNVEPGTDADLWVSLARSLSDAARGRLESALALADRVELAFEQLSWDTSLPDPGVALYVRIRVLQLMGRLHDAGTLVDEAMGFGRDRWSAQAVAWIQSAASSVQRMMGRTTAAASAATESATVFEKAGANQLAAVALAELAAVMATIGDAGAAEDAALRCVDLGVDNFYSRSAHAWAVVAAGRTTDGTAMLGTLLTARRGREAREETLLILDIVRLGGAADVVEAAAQLAQQVDGELVEVVAAYAAAAADDDGSALERIAEQLSELGFALPAAECAVAACAAHLRAGDVRRGRAFQARADELRALLEHAQTPGLHPAEVQAQLAPREREVAAMAARGSTSRMIADSLGLSQRTVETYLQSAYDKLGVSGRSQLAAALEVVVPTPV